MERRPNNDANCTTKNTFITVPLKTYWKCMEMQGNHGCHASIHENAWRCVVHVVLCSMELHGRLKFRSG